MFKNENDAFQIWEFWLSGSSECPVCENRFKV